MVALRSQKKNKEHSVGNTVRKVLHHIREEYQTATNGAVVDKQVSFSISKFVLQGQPRKQATVAKSEIGRASCRERV